MRFLRFALFTLLFAAPLAARETIGSFGNWAAFCDEPKKCYAISEPSERSDHPSLSVAITGATLSVQAHLGRSARAAMLAVGDLHFDLTVADQDARADPRTSRRIVAALRQGETATIIGTSPKGRPFRHHYPLAGAPSAIDAAAVAAIR